MADRPKVTVVAKEKGDRVEIFLHDPTSGKEANTGHTVPKSDADRTIRQVKDICQRSGSEVHVKET